MLKYLERDGIKDSTILLQELWLATEYPSIYWNTAVLQIESGAIEQDKEEDDEEGKEKTTNYAVVGGAIASIQRQGVKIEYPDINRAKTGFAPDEKTDSIMYGMKSITGINNSVTEVIMANRPYSSMRDFYERMCLVKRDVTLSTGKVQKRALVSTNQMINLIKAGSFDIIESKPRLEIIEEFLHWVYPDKTKLTVAHIGELINRDIIPEEYDECLRYYWFKDYLTQGVKYKDETVKSITWYLLDGEDESDTESVVNSFFEMFPELQEGKHWKYNENMDYDPNAIWVATGNQAKGSFEYLYKLNLAPLTAFMASDECLLAYNESLFYDVVGEFRRGTRAKWEMESMCFYHDDHELSHVDKDLYSFCDFFELDEEPVVVDWWQKRDKETGEVINLPKFRIDTICGTVLGADKNKHTIALLTETGVVNIKMEAGKFSFYNRQLSVYDESLGKNRVVEKSWFTRGNILIVRGVRRGDIFRPKVYRNGAYAHSIALVTRVFEDGYISFEDERARID